LAISGQRFSVIWTFRRFDGWTFRGNAAPHSVQTSDVPIGYAHAGHSPRLRRMVRRSLPGEEQHPQHRSVEDRVDRKAGPNHAYR
jgi:hypothetical protein